jgi:steroid 5-alpha reductase family enzyme
MADKGGIDRTHASSRLQKTTFWGLHFVIILLCTWLVLGGGDPSAGSAVRFTDLTRAHILLACAAIYFVRHGLTLFYLLARRIDWGEVFGLTVFFALFELGLILVGGGVFREAPIALSGLDIFALILYLSGSYLNTASEIQRKIWKQDPLNKGHCYTGGLFRFSMHINYFGDVVLFSGWCLLTASFWTLALPLMMLLLFMFMHIPPLDDYLAERYGEEFEVYRTKTRRLIPFLW